MRELQGLQVVKGYLLLKLITFFLFSFKTKPNPKHCVCTCGWVFVEVPQHRFLCCWCVAVLMCWSVWLWRRQALVPGSRVMCPL